MATAIPPEQGGTPKLSYDEWQAKLDESMGQEEEKDQTVPSFWQRVQSGLSKAKRFALYAPPPEEFARSIARGIGGAVNQTVKSVVQGSLALDTQKLKAGVEAQHGTTLPDLPEPSEEERKAAVKSAEQVVPTDKLLGKRSGDPISAFSEDVTQFISAFVATGPLGLESAAARLGAGPLLSVAASAATRGAIVDAVAFDPRQEGLAELVARAPVPVVQDLGKALSVEGDDSEAVARLKRAAAGMIPGVAIDGLVAAARWARAAKVGDHAAMEIQANVLNSIDEGTHIPDGAHVSLRPAPDGSWEIKTNIKELPEGIPEPPKFRDRAEGEAQVETMNFAIDKRLQANKLPTGEEAIEVGNAFRRLMQGPNTAADFAALADGTHFNFSYYSEPKHMLAAIESLSQVFKREIDAAQKAGGVSVEENFRMAQELIGGIPIEKRTAFLAEELEMPSGTKLPREVVTTAADLVMRRSARDVSILHDIVTARPHDQVAFEELRNALGSMLKLQKALAEEESRWGRQGRFAQEKDAFAKADATGTVPKSTKNVKVQEAPPIDLPDVAGMSQREVAVISRMVKMAGGNPRNLFAVARGARTIKETGILRAGLEVFTNSLLSGLAIPTSVVMNSAETVYRAGVKMLAGAGRAAVGAETGGAQFRQGLDMMYSHFRYFGDNFKAAAAAFKSGRSIINPQDVHISLSSNLYGGEKSLAGAIGDKVRLPSRGLLFADEFTRVTNYRSYVRAKSLRYWRDKGLDGQALYMNVEKDLQSAFDSKGVATLPEAMTYAEGPTMSAPLGKNTLGGDISDFLNKRVEARFVAPFVKTSINVFRTTWERTPGLNFFNKRANGILMGREGAEAATELWAQTGLAGSMYVYAYMKAKSGEVTGRGPSDPQLRKLWLANDEHKPYSIKIGGKWVSYRRADPLFAPLGIAADLSLILDEVHNLGHGEADAGEVATAFVAALAASFSNKTYMQGVNGFFEAWSGDNAQAMKRWMYGLGTGFIPQGASQLNADPYLREVDSFKDAVMSKIPGLSEKLPAMYDIFGEPAHKNRTLGPFPDAKKSVASDLLELGKGFAPLPRSAVNGRVDLTDRERFQNSSGLSPYERMQELIREPMHGRPPLKDALTDLVKSDKWAKATDGSDLYPGGKRWQYAANIIDSYQRRSYAQVLKEYPELKDAIRLERKIEMASKRGGQEKVDDLLGSLAK